MADTLDPQGERFVLMYCEGRHTNSELAKEFGVSRVTIYNWIESYNKEISQLMNDIKQTNLKYLQTLTLKALKVQDNAMDNPDVRVGLSAAADITRHGLPTESKQEISGTDKPVLIINKVGTVKE